MERQSFPNRIFGADVHFLGPISEDQRTAAAEKWADDLRRAGRRPYIVGEPVTAALGYVVAAKELLTQSEHLNANLRHVVLPGSMGPTEAGFLYGNALLGRPFMVHLISVEYDRSDLADRVHRIYAGLEVRTGLGAPALTDADFQIHMDYLGPGYDVPTPESEQAILDFARKEGILLEHTYTAKTFAGFRDLVCRHIIPPGEAACVIHTGGVPSLFTQYDFFESLDDDAGRQIDSPT